MKQSEFIIKTLRESPKDESAENAKLLIRAGFIHKVGAGIYAYLPLGMRVLTKIANIAREEMKKIGGNELLLPALHPKEYWEKTGRWDGFDALYKIKAREHREYALGPTHEEIIVPLAKTLIQSYKDLPLYLYQIQTKFRDEPRAKSGILRGREFLMKDLYSFHENENDLEKYYEKVANAYTVIFKRCGLNALMTEASGGTFSQFSHEYQVEVPNGEDIVFTCNSCNFARNREIIEGKLCPNCKKPLQELKTTEVGNIFKLGTKYSKPFDLSYKDKEGKTGRVIMGCYGIGISRLMGTIAEAHNDEKGIIWPEEVAPFAAHLVSIKNQAASIKGELEKIYNTLTKHNIDALYDDREDKATGEKFMEADLIGIPWRVVISEKTIQEGKIEAKKRSEKNPRLLTVKELLSELRHKVI